MLLARRQPNRPKSGRASPGGPTRGEDGSVQIPGRQGADDPVPARVAGDAIDRDGPQLAGA